MARIRIEAENREITDVQEIQEFLEPHGIWYEQWDVAGRIKEDTTNEEILAAYEPEIERLKERGGFVTADVISVSSDTPGLDEMLAKFSSEHTHSEDEVRFTISGSGLFHIHPSEGPTFGIQVESGDLINVPRDTRHWFDLCSTRNIRCIRLFEDTSGWAPHYVDDPIHEEFSPLCMGPDYLPPSEGSDSVVQV
ncbi:MAG: acireductone dioxygenase [Planctomycetaceae bacterium]|nr:acireductone dioxygenase [Planctomycetaceae bacterium]MCP4814943.1 acireductone dioxygenase [Planctomycetaceae bacterium]